MDTVRIGKHLKTFLLIGLIIVLASLFYFPALFEGKTQIHGDSILTGLPLLDFQAKALHGIHSLLWTNLIYGGHPIFAEGQGAFAHPLNILIAFLIPPVLGQNLFHWICIILGSTGTFALCRFLGLTQLASIFGAISLGFSSLWLGVQNNMPISGSLAWVPWTIFAMEYWLRIPGLKSSIFFAMAAALLVLAGYPQAFHGTLIYMVISLLLIPFDATGRNEARKSLGKIVVWGALAIVLCVGLTAIQWLPLVELISLSYRSRGIPLIHFPLINFFRGFIYSFIKPDTMTPQYPVVGSLFVCVIASLSVFFKMPHRIKAHILSGIFLVSIGLGSDSPVFRFFYQYHLVPGLHFFRTMTIYLNIAVIAVAVSAAFAIDKISGIEMAILRPNEGHSLFFKKRTYIRRWKAKIVFGLMVIAGFWIFSIQLLHTDEVPSLHYIILLAAGIGAITLFFIAPKQIPLLFIFFLVLECVSLRFNQFHFADRGLLSKPESVKHLERQYDLDLYKIVNMVGHSTAYGFVHPLSKDIEYAFSKMLASNTAMTNMFWNVPSYDGALGLYLRRRRIIDNTIMNEIRHPEKTPTGLRLIDLLGIRFIAVPKGVSIPGFKSLFQDDTYNVKILENQSALPKYQVYEDYVFVDSEDEALLTLKTMQRRLLVLERRNDGSAGDDDAKTVWNSRGDQTGRAIRFQALRTFPTEYIFDVTAESPGWLFIADAPYPGWQATVDDKNFPVFNAQVLGKAVPLPEGRHIVRLFFNSNRFYFGMLISIVSAISIIIAMLFVYFKKSGNIGGRKEK